MKAHRAFYLLALLGGTADRATAAEPAASNPAEAQPVQLEPFEVTGTHIKRVEYDGPQPVVSFTRQEIEISGYPTLGDFLQSQPFNTGVDNQIIDTGGWLPGVTTANPRGLGNNRFLTLLDGRRAPTFALSDPSTQNQTVFDFNSIPAGAIDHVEFLKDGASAIYGSDAITGVLNIKLRRNYSGTEVELFGGNTLDHDTFTRRIQVLTGGQCGRTSATLGVSWQAANANYLHDYDRSKSQNYALIDPVKGINQLSAQNWPANVNLTAAQANVAGLTGGAGVYVIAGGQPTANPQASQFVRVGTANTQIPDENRYSYARTYGFYPEYEYRSAFAFLDHVFSPRLTAFAQVFYNENLTWQEYTPPLIAFRLIPGAGPAGTLLLPATNPYNPFKADLTNVNYRTTFAPSRSFDTDSVTLATVAGLRGRFNPEWTWEAGATYNANHVDTVAHNMIRPSDLQAVLLGTTRATALNVFGPSDNPAIETGLFTTSTGDADLRSWGGDFTTSRPMTGQPGWWQRLGVATGGEWRREEIETHPDITDYISTLGRRPIRGDRTVFAAYAEVAVPQAVGGWDAEFQLAGRYENYSDFGDTAKPKVAGKVRTPRNATVDLVLRGSYSESFRAPDLSQLYQVQSTAFALITDPLRPQDGLRTINVIIGGNPDLQPEEAVVWFGGIILESPKIKRLSLSVDYFDIEVTNAIRDLSTGFLLSPRGQALFPNAVVRDNTFGNPGPVQSISTISQNLAAQAYQGYDLSLAYVFPEGSAGQFRLTLDATRIVSFASDAGLGAGWVESAGRWNMPKWRGTGTLRWNRRAWSANLVANYIGPYLFDQVTATGWGVNPVTILNASVSYRGLAKTELSVGVNNVLGTEPPFNGWYVSGFDTVTYGRVGLGRFVWIRAKRSF